MTRDVSVELVDQIWTVSVDGWGPIGTLVAFRHLDSLLLAAAQERGEEPGEWVVTYRLPDVVEEALRRAEATELQAAQNIATARRVRYAAVRKLIDDHHVSQLDVARALNLSAQRISQIAAWTPDRAD